MTTERTNEPADIDTGAISNEYMQERLARARGYTLAVLRKTAKLAEADSQPIVVEHGRRNMALAAAGTLPIVCPVADDSDLAGIGIFDAPPTEVEQILSGDPGVMAGIFTFSVHPIRGFPGASLP